MKTPLKACGTALAIVALGLALAGCGSDSKTGATSLPSSSASSSSKPSESKPSESKPANVNKTIGDYVKEAGITETPVRPGDPGSPTIDLPVPEGWGDAGEKTPRLAYSAIEYSDPAAAADPPKIIAHLVKLTGPVEAAKVLEFAPGELMNLPGFDSMGGDGKTGKLGGFDAFQFGGVYPSNGVKHLIAQKTVVIPAKDGSGLYVLQLVADGSEEQMGPLLDATTEIDEKTTITP
jgi:Probable lipoprotein LpqN